MRLYFLMCLCVILALVAGYSLAAPERPQFETTTCWFQTPTDSVVACGYVEVPADRGNPLDGQTVRLAVAVFRGSGGAQDPVIFLSGGPGSKTVEKSAPALAELFAPIYGERDFIVFDQRGVGVSEPALECPEWLDTYVQGWREADGSVVAQALFDATVACGERLAGQGYNLSAFNTTENAADVKAIRDALGYDQVNLFGVSYGSVLAQAVMRDYADAVRSAVIDSAMALDGSFLIDSVTSPSAALLRLLDACANDGACAAAYPSLRADLFETIDRLNGEPVPMYLFNSRSGRVYEYVLTGDSLAANLKLFLYQAPFLPLVPQTIVDVKNNDYTLFVSMSSALLPAYEGISRGMMFSVLCTEDVIGRTPDELLERLMALPPQLRGRVDPSLTIEFTTFGMCEHWPVTPADARVKQPISGTIPTLVLAGEYDPVAPPESARRVVENLSNGYFYEFPAIGHGVTQYSACARDMSGAFFANPWGTPDAACVEQLPPLAFRLPETTVVAR